RASSRAVASPMPREAPVINATWALCVTKGSIDPLHQWRDCAGDYGMYVAVGVTHAIRQHFRASPDAARADRPAPAPDSSGAIARPGLPERRRYLETLAANRS